MKVSFGNGRVMKKYATLKGKQMLSTALKESRTPKGQTSMIAVKNIATKAGKTVEQGGKLDVHEAQAIYKTALNTPKQTKTWIPKLGFLRA